MSTQEQRSNLSTPLVGDPPTPPFMSRSATGSPLVGTLRGACSNHHNYSIAYGPDRFQLPEAEFSNAPPTPSSSSTPSGCAHHNHNHHHMHHAHNAHHAHYEHHEHHEHHEHQHQHEPMPESTLHKNLRNKMMLPNGDVHEYQQLALRRAISSDESQPNSVEVYQPPQNVHDTTNSDSDYLSSNLNIGANGRGCCHHMCRCTARRAANEANQAGGSQDATTINRKK